MLTKNLELFLEKNREYIKEVSGLLSKTLPESPPVLIRHINDLIIHRARIAVLLAEANSLLDLAENDALIPKTKSVTELDREVKKNAAVREYRMWRDILYGIIISTDSSRNWSQSVLAFEKLHLELEGAGA